MRVIAVEGGRRVVLELLLSDGLGQTVDLPHLGGPIRLAAAEAVERGELRGEGGVESAS